MKINMFSKSLTAAVVALLFATFASAAFSQILGSAPLNVERRGHTATQIAGGKVLVVGGENTAGVVNQAEVYDSSSQTFLIVGASSARTDHTATLLSDGRVLIAGGRDSVSALDSTEIFNPADNSFSAGPSLKRARAGHTATTLSDGTILLVGGDAEGSAEILDVDHQLSTLAGVLAEPRTLHGAGLLKDGRVLIAGGVDPADASQVLDSAEIFDPQSSQFSAAVTTMVLARALPTIRVLSDGKVQVIGGDSEWSMEMFDPAKNIFLARVHLPPTADLLTATLSTQSRAALISTTIANNPYAQAALSDPAIAELLDRADHTVTELADSDQALVTGGVSSSQQVLGSAILVQGSAAAVTTDKFDYFPGDPVTITGTGFQAGEQITILLHEEPETHQDTTLTVSADANGNFTNSDFAPAQSDLGRSFSLTATGASGRAAQTAFSDANPADNPGQCANGPASAPVSCSGTNWVGGNINSTKSHYAEGQIVPYRLVLTNIPGGSNGFVDFAYDVTKGGKHATDYLSDFDFTETTGAANSTNANQNDPCGDEISGCNPASPDATAAITVTAANFTFPAGCQSSGSFGGSAISGSIKAWHVVSGGLSFSYPIAQNQGSSGNCSTTVRVSWSNTTGIANGSTGTIVIAFGGHISSQDDWGTGNSAGNINGSPYHIEQVGMTVNGDARNIGTQALSLSIKAKTKLTTTPNPSSGTVGVTLNDSASLTGGGNTPSGTVTFKLYSPSNPNCSGTPTYTKIVNLVSDTTTGTASTTLSGTTTGSNVTNAAGTWRWVATYSGDTNNNSATSGCDEEQVTVNEAVTKITIKKVIVGGTGTFTFTGTPNGTISTNNGTISLTVSPGTYTTTETAQEGWTITNISCDDDASPSSGNTSTGVITFHVDSGENVTCTVTNARTGSVTIKKVMVAGSGTFTFTGTPNGTISTNNGTITASVPPGTYTATETAQPNWVVTSIVCDDSESTTPSTGDVPTKKATFHVDPGENVTCTFTNTFVSGAQDVAIATTLSGSGQTGTLIAVPLNTPVTDQAFLSGVNAATAGGQVTYSVYSDSSCNNLVGSGGTKNVTNGVGASSDPVSFSQPGTYYWRIDYSGDANNNAGQSNCTDEQMTVYRILVKLTPTKDSFIKEEDPDTNEGANRRLRLAALNGSSSFAVVPKKQKQKAPKTKKGQPPIILALSSGVDRPVAAFNVSGLNVTGLIKAQLVFNIATNNGGWGDGQAVDVQRILSNWSEGNGKNPDLSTGTTTRGSGSGVTWNCPIDTQISNTSTNCAAQWGGGNFAASTAAPVVHTNSSSGDMVWDVTTDVLGGEAAITNGWIVKKHDENQTGGEVLYYSKEGATAAGALNLAPRLILYYQ